MEHVPVVTIDRRAPLAFDRTPLSIARDGMRDRGRHSARSAPLSRWRDNNNNNKAFIIKISIATCYSVQSHKNA